MKKQQKNNQNPKSRALKLLGRRDYTVLELRQRLEKEEFLSEEIDQVVLWLQELKYLDDYKTAQNWVESRNRFRPKGRFGIQQELKNKGVSDEIIEDVINSPETEYELATEIARKRYNSMNDVPVKKQYQRIGSLLSRRGFSWDVITRVLRDLFDSHLDTDH